MKYVIEKLRDDAEYYGGIGKNYLSNSDISALLNNPKDFGVSKADNPVFAKGRVFHQIILEPEKAKDTICLLYTSPSPRDRQKSRMPSSA